ncbi:hypothetical protein D9756_000551 [Leucocoprinus leucothites]|uniref:BZIP domain-containing protein n=1 Tax=Leucocoprinus leucothites TaxID=201217 RepID=A0A8H5GG26_9AGAR|nr:hypothetical protein D9756_000551 [Leucoagaricus leucothites]
MPESKEARDRSVSGDLDDSDLDLESHAGDGPNLPGKPGRKKNPNSQAARRDQNRIAQREFRLRKQQRIRDLEARVEILSGGKDEALGEMRNILKDLMAENHTLRGLIRSLAGFIGEGAGGLLPKLGWDLADFNDFVNKSETDTAWESYHRRKKTTGSGEPSSSQLQGQKRSVEDEATGSRKKSRSDEPERDQTNGYPLLVSMNHSIPAGYSPTTRPQERNGVFSELIRGPNASPLYMHQSPTTSTSSPYNTAPNSNTEPYQSTYISNVNMAMESPLSTVAFDSSSSRSGSSQQQRVGSSTTNNSDELEVDDDPNKNEAYKLIQYHLDNFKRNPNYCLPLSLRPTLVTDVLMKNESVMDNILHPELRDRMILLRARYSLPDCLIDYRRSIVLHGDDVLAHSNWEISEPFLRKYGFLIDQATLNISNRWRKERGESELRLSELTGSDAAPAAS